MNKILDMENRSRKILVSLIAILFLSSLGAFAQSDWEVSDAKVKVTNTVKADAASLKDGKALFNTNCKSCHGDPGKDNGLPLIPKPTDMANAAFLSANSDGAIFTKISDGRVTMPSFKAVLSDAQRWQIVNYIRSFDANNKSVVTITVVDNKGIKVEAPYQLSLEYSAEENIMLATVLGTTADGQMAPASDVEVGFFMKRYFGDLPFGEVGGVTDENGMIQAEVPVDLPGGEEGKATAFVRLADYADVTAETDVNVKPIHIINLLDERSLWTVSAMAPWWLIFTYFGLLIGVWGTLGYVVFQLVKIKQEGA
jgi:mono/diheme cytochrome c family protein